MFNKQSGFFIPALFFFTVVSAQPNLIPNSSFETLSGCPISSNQMTLAPNWQVPQGTPDLFCYCSTNTQVATPSNFIGFQCPNTGYNYGGYMAYFGNNGYNEILGIKLTDSLLIGTTYYASFKISLAGSHGANSDACSHHGLKLSTKPLPNLGVGTATPTNAIINNFAHIYTTQLITDTINWITIKGSLIADSNYKHVYFGQFFQQSSVTYTTLFGPSGFGCYYYIDDVCLSTDSNTCKIPTQTTCFPTKISDDFSLGKSIEIFPQPAKDIIIVSLSYFYEPTVEVKIIDVTGKQILNKEIEVIQGKTQLSIENISNGVYILQLMSKNQVAQKRLIITR